jgi:hypothetical protein
MRNSLVPEGLVSFQPEPASIFACKLRRKGVHRRRELKELRRGHDSTGLRAEPKLITPLSWCASLAKHTCSLRASETTQQISEKGEPSGFPFLILSGRTARRAMTPAMQAAMPAMVPIVRRSWIGCLCLAMAGRRRQNRLRLGIGSGLRSKKRWCSRQHEKTHDTFHGLSSQGSNPPWQH